MEASGAIAAAAGWWMRALRARNLGLTESKLAAFELALKERLAVEFSTTTSRLWLDVENLPCFVLEEVVRAAGLEHVRYPRKTTMEVSPELVRVSVGFQEPWARLFPAGGRCSSENQ